ncbi:electron transport complex subunit RsxC [Ectopseudomonas mendocina]|uniref:Ion-translocating oxidoreductase complex subunit C n=1 Tax=Ectopseudomonas mendocina TaxID=300 RepID=A0ABZ2RBG4_ECTME
MTAMSTPNTRIWDIPGGIHPEERKELSNRMPIQPAPQAKRLTLPLNQHIGAPAEPVVAVGERVLKGQQIARANGFVSAALHAPTSGTVSFIGPQPYPHASGMLTSAIVIDADGLDEWTELSPCPDYRALEPAELLERIRQAGISGMGGAGFPTAVKLNARPTQKIHTLIINGTECEPYITADDVLMRERAAELLSGVDILAHLIQPEQVLIGIEDNKPEAISAIRAAMGERSYAIKVFPTKYPSGGEKQLIQILTGVEVPSGGLPADIGMLCQNVGTCVAVHDAVIHGKPLISRITTLTGEALERPMNVEVLLGTPVSELLQFAGLNENKLNRLIMGGPMMGFTLTDTRVPVIKTTNCLLASTAEELPPPPPAMPCIRCGECAEACPASLLPQQLHFFAIGQEHEQLKAHNLFDCIECGACAYVCPSSIPLVQYYRVAKAEIRELEQKQLKAEHSKQRFELRQERLRRAEEQKEADRQARAARAAAAKAAQAQTPAAPEAAAAPAKPGLSEEQKKLKIEASMAQVALKKAEKQLAAHDTPELQAQVEALRQAAAAAQKALDAAMASTPAAPAAAPAADDADLKKAKIDAAMLRAQVRKLEKVEEPTAEQQAELQQLRSQLEAAEKLLASLQTQAPATTKAAPAADDAELKKAKIDAAMLKAQLRKLEKVEEPSAEQQAELQQLRSQLETAEKLLASLQKQAPATTKAAPAADDAELKKAKIDAAMLKAQLRKLEKVEEPTPEQQAELQQLRSQLEAAEKRLADLQNQAPAAEKPQPTEGESNLKKAKVELAMRRAELKKAEKAGADEATLAPLQQSLAEAEQALHAAEEASGKPAPELVRTDKKPIDETTRALKTEVAFARADLRKLEREGSSPADALEAARARLNEAERKLQEHTGSL